MPGTEVIKQDVLVLNTLLWIFPHDFARLGCISQSILRKRAHLITKRNTPGPRDYQGKRVNLQYRPYARVIPLKIFLEMVPSYSAENVTRAMRGQHKRLSCN